MKLLKDRYLLMLQKTWFFADVLIYLKFMSLICNYDTHYKRHGFKSDME